jgi:hypothetical protein
VAPISILCATKHQLPPQPLELDKRISVELTHKREIRCADLHAGRYANMNGEEEGGGQGSDNAVLLLGINAKVKP